ncbi:MAG: nitrite/sulfite reductase [Candidatus Odinarchaeota archaeon]
MSNFDSTDIEYYLGRYSLGRDSNPRNIMDSLHFLRFKVPGGFLTSGQFRGIAELTKTYSKGLAEITDREDIQLHWIKSEDSLKIFSIMDKLGFTTDMCGQGFGGARYGDARNIICCPVMGIDENEIMDGRALMSKLTNFLVGNPDFLNMPKKFKFSISGCGNDCTRGITNDLAYIGVKKGEDIGYTLFIGGSAGSTRPGPRLAKRLHVFIPPEDAFDLGIAMIEIHRDHSNRETKAKARFKWLVNEWGVEKIKDMIEEKLGKKLEPYNGPTFYGNSNHEGIHPQKQEGLFYFNVPIIGGRMTYKEMIFFADIADKYGSGELRLTPTQNIIIHNIKQRDVVLKLLEKNNFSFNGPLLKWSSIGCSSDFCGKSMEPHAKDFTKEIVNFLIENYNTTLLNDSGIIIKVNGCPNHCCASSLAEIGLSGAITKNKKGESIQAFDIVLGGGIEPNPSLGRVIERHVPHSQIIPIIANLIQNYIETKSDKENFREFCNKKTEEELKIILNKKIK